MNEDNNNGKSIDELKRQLKLYFPEEVVNTIESSANWDDPEFRDRISQLIESQKQGILGPTTVNGWIRRPEPQVVWDIKQLMAQGTTTIISGNTGIGKSWETKHLAFQFRLGGNWHGLPCRQLMPIYVCLEFTDNQMHKRIKKLARIYPTIRDIHFLAHKGYDYRLNTVLGRDNLLKQLRSFNQQFGVIILDPLASFIKGKVEQVDWNNEVEPILTMIKLEFGCSIILNHNFRKRVQIYGHGEDMFAPDRIKGVSDIIDRADNIVVFISESQPRKDPDGKSQRMEIAKWIHAAKTRDAEVELPFHRVKWDSKTAMFVPEDGLGWIPFGNLTDNSL